MKNITLVPGGNAPVCLASTAWFLFKGEDLILAERDAPFPLPLNIPPLDLGIHPIRSQYLGHLVPEAEGEAIVHCFSGEVDPQCALPDGFISHGLRQIFLRFDPQIFGLIGRAKQIMAWDRDHQYCGRCGQTMKTVPNEWAKVCPACTLTSYPRIAPAMIVAITRTGLDGKEEILLARNHRFQTGRYSVIAGFVEPGESLETCVAREVREEVGITVDTIRYFGSQSWPFPHSLMVGFTARYTCGEIRLEESEIADARWFNIHNLPQIPPKISIARQLIDAFVAKQGGNTEEIKEW